MSREGLSQHFPPQHEVTLQQHDLQMTWTQNLHALLEDLNRSENFHPDTLGQIHEAIDAWQSHPDHGGGQHSLDVYQGMVYIAKSEGKWNPTIDSMLQALATLHDMFQFIPFTNPYTGETLEGNQRKLHAQTMTIAVRLYGECLGLTEDEVDELAIGIWRHDDSYVGIYHDDLPYSAQVLADADKLFGAGLITDFAQIARQTIERNLFGATKRDGWYILRDLTPTQRNAWQYGDRYLSDAVSAVRADMFGTKFYTETGKKMAKDRQKAFLMELDKPNNPYTAMHDTQFEAVNAWQSAHTSHATVKVELVGKDQDPISIKGAGDIYEVIDEAFNKPLPLNKSYVRDGFLQSDLRGFKIQVTVDSKQFIMDPSVARFRSREKFMAAVKKAFTS